MKICVVQTRPVKGDVQRNIDDHKKFIDLALAEDAEMIVFPELSLTGYEPTLAKDFATHQDDGRLDAFQIISNTSQVTIGVGMPTKTEDGNCISMVIFRPHRTRQTYSKKYIHADEEPFFVCGQNFPVLRVNGTNIGLAICYELSVSEHAQQAFASEAAIYIASVAKSARGVDNAHKRLAEIAGTYAVPVLFSNCVGSSEGFVSAGKTAVWSESGFLLGQLDDVHEGIIVYDMGTQEVIAKSV